MTTLISLLVLLVVAYLPGAVIYRLPVADRDRRAALDAEERVFWGAVLSCAWSSAVVMALAAWGHYRLELLLGVNAALVLTVLLSFRGTLRLGPARRRATATIWLPGALIALGAVFFFPPFEHVLGGKDPGTYLNEGVQLARQGTLVFRDPVVAWVPAALRDLFYPSHHVAAYYGVRFMGFHILDPAAGTVVGQFPHLFPAWIAVGYGIAGIRGALAATPIAALLGLLAVYFAGARLLGKWPAFAGAALLALNVATVWFAREPNSEVLAQALLFAAFLAFGRAQVDGDRFFAPVAGMLYGLSLFVRFDMVLAFGCVVVVSVLQVFDRRRPRLPFVVPLAALAALGWLYMTRVLTIYAMRPLAFLQVNRGSIVVGGALGAVGLVALVLLAQRERVGVVIRRAVPAAIIAAVGIAACYAYFLRQPVYGKLAFGDARSLEIFTWYFPPLALGVALVGYAMVVWRAFWRAPALLLTTAVYCLFLFYKLWVVPEHFWVARRFIPVILPAASLMFAAVLAHAAAIRARSVRVAATTAATLAVIVLGAQLVRANRAIVGHVEYRGAVARLDDLKRRFTPDDLVIFEARNTDSDLHVLALPLAYCWQQPVLVLDSPVPDKQMVRVLLASAAGRYRNVYFVGGGGTNLVSRSIQSDPVMSERFQLPEYESRKNAYPRAVRYKEFDFGVYRLRPSTSTASTFALEIGQLDDLNVVRFYAKEKGPDGLAFRWSRRTSYIAAPPLQKAAHEITLWLSDGGRPATAPKAEVVVLFNDRQLGIVRPTTEFRPYSFAVPADAVVPASAQPDDAAVVRLMTNTWTPSKVLGTTDDRELGVMVRRVEIR
ncbi:MAG: hypothetical protein ACM3NQ_23315 [Bacteroidales bacterium]